MEYYKYYWLTMNWEIRDGMIQLDWHQLGYDVAAAAEMACFLKRRTRSSGCHYDGHPHALYGWPGIHQKVIERLPAVKIIVFPVLMI